MGKYRTVKTENIFLFKKWSDFVSILAMLSLYYNNIKDHVHIGRTIILIYVYILFWSINKPYSSFQKLQYFSEAEHINIQCFTVARP